jgi:hypothetical protein
MGKLELSEMRVSDVILVRCMSLLLALRGSERRGVVGASSAEPPDHDTPLIMLRGSDPEEADERDLEKITRRIIERFRHDQKVWARASISRVGVPS